MKTFITATVFAVVVIVLVEIRQSNGQSRRCPQNQKPPLNTTQVTCDFGLLLPLLCRNQCLRCYRPEELQRRVGCMVNRRCTCLAKPGKESSTTVTTESTTTEGTTTEGTTTEGTTTEGSTTEGSTTEGGTTSTPEFTTELSTEASTETPTAVPTEPDMTTSLSS